METPFRAMDFKKHDVLTIDDVNQMQSNLQWLRENTPRGQFYPEGGAVIPDRQVIVCGRVYVGRSKKSVSAKKAVYLGTAFSPKCRPNVTTGLVAQDRRVFVTVQGPRNTAFPYASGFEIKTLMADPVSKKEKWKVKKGFYINWQAAGYRELSASGV